MESSTSNCVCTEDASFSTEEPSGPKSPVRSDTETDDKAKNLPQNEDTSKLKEPGSNKDGATEKTELTAEETGEDGKLNMSDKTDGVYLHRPAPEKVRRNQPEEEGLCMDIVYSTVTCMDSCTIL